MWSRKKKNIHKYVKKNMLFSLFSWNSSWNGVRGLGNLKAIEEFLGYYELPNIQSDTIVAAIKDSMISFELPLQASNMMGKNSGVAQQILKEQPKALSTHCHGHWLSLSIKYANKQWRILIDVISHYILSKTREDARGNQRKHCVFKQWPW